MGNYLFNLETDDLMLLKKIAYSNIAYIKQKEASGYFVEAMFLDYYEKQIEEIDEELRERGVLYD